ncbi:MAG: hypothetical protein J5526_07875 [Bacteroidales bacterium]|nr:hypothetical protein [Bacteroidales bacterium]
MISEKIKQRSLVRAGLIDAALLVAACLIPAMSHLLALPLYMLNPMLMVVVAGMLLVNSRWNAYLLALVVPFVTCLVAGMPTPLGALCMVCEYAAVVTVFGLMARRNSGFWWVFGSILTAVLAGKVVYYLAKWILLRPEQLIGTSLVWQTVSVLAIAAVFALLWYRKNR